MNFRWLFLFCVILLSTGWTQSTDPQNELNFVEQQIKELRRQLHAVHMAELKEEVEGQALSIADWEGYSKELKEIRQQNEGEHQLLIQLERLELRKVELLKLKKNNQAH